MISDDQPTRIHPETRMGAVHLTVADLERSLRFYTSNIGMQILDRHNQHASLGVGELPLLKLEELTGGIKERGRTGLYHFALLLPSRADLASAFRHMADSGVRFSGFADHHVSEALYLSDPDGHGIEVYRDRPRAEWVDARGQFKLTTEPLDLQGLLNELGRSPGDFTGLPDGTVMGHVHLHVAHLGSSRTFYGNVLGFDLMAGMDTALFMSAGGYHHHLGLNIWQGAGAPPASQGSLRLTGYEISIPDDRGYQDVLESLDRHGVTYTKIDSHVELVDPSANRILLNR
jgi:catechol 2,3-dioxygenase